MFEAVCRLGLEGIVSKRSSASLAVAVCVFNVLDATLRPNEKLTQGSLAFDQRALA